MGFWRKIKFMKYVGFWVFKKYRIVFSVFVRIQRSYYVNVSE